MSRAQVNQEHGELVRRVIEVKTTHGVHQVDLASLGDIGCREVLANLQIVHLLEDYGPLELSTTNAWGRPVFFDHRPDSHPSALLNFSWAYYHWCVEVQLQNLLWHSSVLLALAVSGFLIEAPTWGGLLLTTMVLRIVRVITRVRDL